MRRRRRRRHDGHRRVAAPHDPRRHAAGRHGDQQREHVHDEEQHQLEHGGERADGASRHHRTGCARHDERGHGDGRALRWRERRDLDSARDQHQRGDDGRRAERRCGACVQLLQAEPGRLLTWRRRGRPRRARGGLEPAGSATAARKPAESAWRPGTRGERAAAWSPLGARLRPGACRRNAGPGPRDPTTGVAARAGPSRARRCRQCRSGAPPAPPPKLRTGGVRSRRARMRRALRTVFLGFGAGLGAVGLVVGLGVGLAVGPPT